MEVKCTFAAAISCMDGRVQDAVRDFLKDQYSVDYVDMITEAGPNKILADNSDKAIIENIKKRLEISVHHHGSRVVGIVGHFACAGNPVEKEEQTWHLKKARKIVESFNLGIEIVLLWVNGDWKTAERVD